MWHEDVDWRELVWFVGVTVGVHAGVVSLLSSALMVVERYKLFPEAKIQTKVHTHYSWTPGPSEKFWPLKEGAGSTLRTHPPLIFSCMIHLSILSH